MNYKINIPNTELTQNFFLFASECLDYIVNSDFVPRRSDLDCCSLPILCHSKCIMSILGFATYQQKRSKGLKIHYQVSIYTQERRCPESKNVDGVDTIEFQCKLIFFIVPRRSRDSWTDACWVLSLNCALYQFVSK